MIKMKIILTVLVILLFSFSLFGQTERDKGIELYKQGDFNGAIATLQSVVQADKKNRDAWLYLGMSFAKVGKTSEAVKALRKGDSISSKASNYYDKELKIISKPRPRYTETAKQNQTTGTVKLAIEFGADGTIKSIIPIQTLPDGLTESCLEADKNIKFEPASKSGQAVSAISIVEHNFDIH